MRVEMIAGTRCWAVGDEISESQFRKDETICRPLFWVQGATFGYKEDDRRNAL